MRGHVMMPGLVNTHHHMYQSLTRAVPEAQDAELFGWLTHLHLLWARITPEMIRVSTQTRWACASRIWSSAPCSPATATSRERCMKGPAALM